MSRRRVEVWLYSFFNLDARRGWVFKATPRRLYPAKENRYPLYRRLGERVQIVSPSPGFTPWAVQPVASRYSNYSILFNIYYMCMYEL
jgi:hypothetical protein